MMIENIWCGHGQKWMWPVWSREFKIDSISKMNRRNKLTFWMLVETRESQKLIQRFLGGFGKKKPLLLSSLELKICCILRINL